MRAVAFTIADDNNLKYAKMMINSLRKFHSEDELPVKIIGSKQVVEYDDKYFFYRATPIVASGLLKEYDRVIKLDADQIITGSLDYIINSEGWDVGTVYNWNRVDPQIYGEVGVASVLPQEYYNCGLVAMNSAQFVEHWLRLCHSKHFERLKYREQDLLNIMCHYGMYKVKCFDDFDPVNLYSAWHGLRSKGEWAKVELRDKELILPLAEDNYPDKDIEIKILHWAGGNAPNKMNYRLYFSEDIIKYLDYLTADVKKENKKETKT